ncbi:MAG TPA: hypothetical protein VLW85_20425 [Myxococcales bacterium]|nr:hypothetical protein [Myxococcales bacterium]
MAESRPPRVPRPELSADEKLSLEHVLRQQDNVLARRLQWVGDLASLARYCDRFRQQPDMAAMFWIRLYGVLTEVAETQQRELERIADEFLGVDLDAPEWDGVKAMLGGVQGMLTALNELRGALTREDALLVEYMRSAHCCVGVDLYIEQQSGNFRLAAPGETAAEMRQVVAARLAATAGDIGAAIDLAARLEGAIEKLREATETAHRVTWLTPGAR